MTPALSNEVESSFNLSHGRTQLHGATISIREEQGVWAAIEAHRRPAGESETVAGTIEAIAAEPASVAKPKSKRKAVATPRAAPVKRKPGRPRKSTA
jgi:hypothetical protein